MADTDTLHKRAQAHSVVRLPCARGDDPSIVYDGRRDAADSPLPRRIQARAGTIRQDWRLETT